MHSRALSDDQLFHLLRDDTPAGDLTTESLAIGARPAALTFQARGAMTVCGSEEAARLFELAGAGAHIVAPSGLTVEADALLLEAKGRADDLHRAWKVAQTLMEWASGIASCAAAIVAAASPVAVGATRKSVPGVKAMSIKAVKAGGMVIHRLGLSETLLIFAEHRLFLDEEPENTVRRLRRLQPERKIAVEVGTLDELRRWARAGVDVLQLEKFPPEAVAAARAALDGDGLQPVLLAAGGIDAGNAAAYVAAGADALATSAPFTALPRDVQVRFRAAY
ncbi:MAG: ModD protein [Azoarcus sp.]|jgi:molybdenum transport protein|nr:ModD protein [Azoarcus sp.]